MVSLLHRLLKTSPCAAEDLDNSTNHSPRVLLSICSGLKWDVVCFTAEVVFGATIRLSGGMTLPTYLCGADKDPVDPLQCLCQFLQTLSPIPPKPTGSESYLDLETCPHVYL
ncbi:hypothetical protein SprV_0802566900 [Sparganum proliferum]